VKAQLALALALVCPPLWAGYRVHQLKITYYDSKGKAVQTETVLSNLDQLQYEHYHSGYRNMRVELADTWYCPGDTHRRGYCAKPKIAPTRGTASTDPKAPQLPYNRQPIIP
jgi:hypothetical protein